MTQNGRKNDKIEKDYSVCLVTHPLSEASETAVHGLLDLIAASACVSLVTANLASDSEIRDRYEVVDINQRGTGDSIVVAAVRFLRNQLLMARIVRQRDEEIVLFFGAVSYLLPIFAAKISGQKVIVEPRGNVPESLYQIWRLRVPNAIAFFLSKVVWFLERIGYWIADRIIALSPEMAEDLGLYGYDHKLYENGTRPVDVDRFSPNTQYEERPERIGYLGRLDEEKGVDILVKVVKNLDDDYEFVFIGGGVLQEYIKDELSAKIDDGTVKITGWVDHDDIPEYLASLRLMITTARTEGVPTTILESMACGTPVCATSVGGVPDVVEDGETGYLLDPTDSPERYAEQITSALFADGLDTMSDQCREFVVNKYSFEVVVEKYQHVFEDLYD